MDETRNKVICILFVCCVSPVFLVWATVACARPQELDQVDVNQTVALLCENQINLKYVFQELDVLDYQIEELDRAVTKFKENLKTLQLKGIELTEQKLSCVSDNELETVTESFGKLQAEANSAKVQLIEEFEHVLVGNQFENFRNLLVLRRQHRLSGSESFAGPLLVADKLRLQQPELDELEELVFKLNREFGEFKQDRFADSLAEIFEHAPASIRLELSRTFHSRESSFMVPRTLDEFALLSRLASDVAKWQPSDFDDWQALQHVHLVLSLHANPAIKELLSISEHQSTQILEMARSSVRPHEEAIRDERKISAFYRNGQLRDAEELKESINAMESELAGAVAKKICSEVLRDDQLEILGRICRGKRLMIESGFGDRFGVVFSQAMIANASQPEKEEFGNLLLQVRTDFYTDLEERRGEYERRVIKSMAPEAAESFKSLYYDFYDFWSELRASWDEVRSHQNG